MASLAISGPASPCARYPVSFQHFVYDQNKNGDVQMYGNGQVYVNGQVKPPLTKDCNKGYQGAPGMVPLSPETKFIIISHRNRQTHAYFGPTNQPNQYASRVKKVESYSPKKKK